MANIEDENEEFDQLAAEIEANQDLIQTAINSNKPVTWKDPSPIKQSAAIKRTRQVKFLRALAQCGTISGASKLAGINANTQRAWHADPWYVSQFHDAMQQYQDAVSEEVHNRAMIGEEVPIIGKRATPFGMEDAIIGHKRVKSDLLLMFHAKRHIPEYKEKYEPPKDESIQPQESPIARILVRLDMLGQRQDVAIPSRNGGMTVIDITPDSGQLSAADDTETPLLIEGESGEGVSADESEDQQ